MIRRSYAATAVAIAFLAAGASHGATSDDPNLAISAPWAWPEIPEELRYPAPPDAKFTPDMTWESIQQLPKLWGVGWNSQPKFVAQALVFDRLVYPPLKPEFLAASKALTQRIVEGTAETQYAGCKPFGMTRTIWYTAGPTFLFQPGDRLLLGQRDTREIWMDGRPHPERIDPDDLSTAYLGHSVGWWEGETLVIDTVGIHPDHELYYGVPSMGQHVVERWRLKDPNTLEVRMTVDAPNVLEEPWVFVTEYVPQAAMFAGAPGGNNVPGAPGGNNVPGGPTGNTVSGGPAGGGSISTFNCNPEDNRQKVDAEGNLYTDLTPPPPGIH